MRIELVIDELVLHGFDPRHRHAIGDAVEAELTRLMARHALNGERHQPMVLDQIDAGAMAAAPGRSAGDLGRDIARAIAGSARGGGSLDRPSAVAPKSAFQNWPDAAADLSGPLDGADLKVGSYANFETRSKNPPTPRQACQRRGDA